MTAVAIPAVLWCPAIMGLYTDRKTDRDIVCTCGATAVLMLETTQFGQHEDLIHVQHNDGMGACINMSLGSSLWGHTHNPMTTHAHTATGCVSTLVSGHTLLQQTNILSRHPGKQR